MDINSALAAELTILTEALDDAGIDIAESVLLLAADARAAVTSYLGLMVIIARSDPPVVFTAFEDGVDNGDIRTSLMLVPTTVGSGSAPDVSLVLFAAVPGAFIDLAADLCWMTGRPLTDVILDQHLTVLVDGHGADTLRAASAINQALGVLMGRGCTREQADLELAARAADAGTDRNRTAVHILSTIPVADAGPEVDMS